MGIIKAAAGAIGGGLADQWLEVYEPAAMDSTTVLRRALRSIRIPNVQATQRRRVTRYRTVPSSTFMTGRL